jgi:proteasome lid subunit RPN8/RPN11
MLVLPQWVAEELKALARAAMPHECCGALLGTRDGERRVVGALRPARNIAAVPQVEYVVHPDDLLRILNESERGGPDRQLLGFYHSHPYGPDGPSGTDRSRATWDGFAYVLYSVTSDKLGSWVWDGAAEQFRSQLIVVDHHDHQA